MQHLTKLNQTLVLFVLLLISWDVKAIQPPTPLSDSARISLLTCSAGEEIYSTFGHSAIRIYDPVIQRDITYNYGTFSFGEWFIPKFVRGNLMYSLSKSSFVNFLHGYDYEGRGVREQELNLSPDQIRKVYAALEKNYLPENKYYRYDFLFDNCATRIRDIFEQALGNEVNFQYPFEQENKSYRNLIDQYAYHLEWLDFGMDMMLGPLTDQRATGREYVFLPDYLAKSFAASSITYEGKTQNLVGKEKVWLKARYVVPRQKKVSTPTLFFIALFVFLLLLGLLELKLKKAFFGFDVFIYILLGIIGSLFIFMWIGTLHKVSHANHSIIWANPLLFLGAFWLLRKSEKAKRFLLFYAIVCLLFLAAHFFFVQQFPLGILILVGTLAFRALWQFIFFQNKLSN